MTNIAAISRDITDRKLSQEQLREQSALIDLANKAIASMHEKLETEYLRGQPLEGIDPFADGMAYEINNILTPILTSVRLLREGLPPDLKEEVISAIESSAQRGGDLIKQLLAFADGTEGPQALNQPARLASEAGEGAPFKVFLPAAEAPAAAAAAAEQAAPRSADS